MGEVAAEPRSRVTPAWTAEGYSLLPASGRHLRERTWGVGQEDCPGSGCQACPEAPAPCPGYHYGRARGFCLQWSPHPFCRPKMRRGARPRSRRACWIVAVLLERLEAGAGAVGTRERPACGLRLAACGLQLVGQRLGEVWGTPRPPLMRPPACSLLNRIGVPKGRGGGRRESGQGSAWSRGGKGHGLGVGGVQAQGCWLGWGGTLPPPVAQWTSRVNGGRDTQQSHAHTHCALGSSRVPCRALLLGQAQSHPPVSPTTVLGKPLKSRACTLISVTLALGGGTRGASGSHWVQDGIR